MPSRINATKINSAANKKELTVRLYPSTLIDKEL